jgi:hypothetical protein
MAKPTCVMIPGILGSSLYIQGYSGPIDPDNPYANSKLLWVNIAGMGPREWQWLTLQPDGVTPVDPKAPGPVIVGNPLGDYYGHIMKVIASWADLIAFPYDFRFDITTNGSALAKLLVAKKPALPVYLVGHSMGGLVARECYKSLKAVAKDSWVERIVTLATPHWGSWDAAAACCGAGSTADLVQTFAFTGVQLPPNRKRIFVRDAAATWPGLVEMLPSIQPNSPFVNLPQTADVWKLAWYGNASPTLTQDNLDRADAFQKALVWTLPKGLVVPVIGFRFQTIHGHPADGEDRLVTKNWPMIDVGDQNVLEVSAQYLPGIPHVYVAAGHSAITSDFRVSEALESWCVNGLPSDPTTPPDVVLPGQPNPPGTDARGFVPGMVPIPIGDP